MKWFRSQLSYLLFGYLLVVVACTETNQQEPHSTEAALEAIRELHQQDQQASRARDLEALVALWSEEGVLLAPGSDPVVGRPAIRDWLKSNLAESAHLQLFHYDQTFEDITVVEQYAFEWGTYSGAYQTPSGDTLHSSGKLMRILERQPDGGWKVARALWH